MLSGQSRRSNSATFRCSPKTGHGFKRMEMTQVPISDIAKLSFDHLVGAREHGRRHGEAERGIGASCLSMRATIGDFDSAG